MKIADNILDNMLGEACRKALEIGSRVSIAIVDDAGHLLRFSRMAGSPLISIDVSQDKAYTAAACGVATHALYDSIKDDPALLRGIPEYPRIVVLGGGYPFHVGDTLAGGVGVSGGSPEEDMEVARAAMSVL